MEAVFETAYRGLPPDAARLYRLLGLLPGSDFTAALAGALAGGEVRPLIGTLLETYLVVEALPERYRLHELVRGHAAHAAEGEPAAERDEALRRAVAWYSRMVTAAHCLVLDRPGESGVFDGPGEALDWLESERGNLLALLRQASTAGWDELVRRSAEAMWALYANRKHYADWLETSRLGTLSAHRLGDWAAEARMRDQTARALIELSDFSAAAAELDKAAAGVAQAAEGARAAGSEREKAAAVGRTVGGTTAAGSDTETGAQAADAAKAPGATRAGTENPEPGSESPEPESTEGERSELGSAEGESSGAESAENAASIGNAGSAGSAGSERAEAGAVAERAAEVWAVMMETRGLLELARGNPDAAAERFEEGARVYEALGDSRGKALLTYQRGRALAVAGRHQEAAQGLEVAAGLAHDDELTRGRIAIVLGQVYRRLGRTEEAEVWRREGAEIMRVRRIPVKE
ncbi:hypothetical protein [Nonomuraea endophytica]|uniref:hypothetical protein n=1 Tax=Nonomuraea endophytica TaxID=714136 RepID=UPI0037C6F73B